MRLSGGSGCGGCSERQAKSGANTAETIRDDRAEANAHHHTRQPTHEKHATGQSISHCTRIRQCGVRHIVIATVAGRDPLWLTSRIRSSDVHAGASEIESQMNRVSKRIRRTNASMRPSERSGTSGSALYDMARVIASRINTHKKARGRSLGSWAERTAMSGAQNDRRRSFAISSSYSHYVPSANETDSCGATSARLDDRAELGVDSGRLDPAELGMALQSECVCSMIRRASRCDTCSPRPEHPGSS
jgi:hypothetical protein